MREFRVTSGYFTPRDIKSVNILLDEIRKIKPYTPQEEIDIIARYKETQDERTLNDIVKHNLKFVVSVAKQYQRSDIPFEDLIESGALGLVKAIHKFDNRGIKLISYAVWDIRAEILLYIKEFDRIIRIPSSLRNIAKLAESKNLAYGELSEKEQFAIDKTIATRTKSLDDVYNDDFTLIDVLPNDDCEDPLSWMDIETKQKFISNLLKYLTPREADIMCHSYQLNDCEFKSANDLALEYKISVTRINDIRKNCIFKLKHKMRSKEFRKSKELLFG